MPGIGIYFSTIHYLKGKFEHTKNPLESMLIGGTARSVAVVTMLPFTVLKTRYEVRLVIGAILVIEIGLTIETILVIELDLLWK